ncbi:hypothetical protein HanIR_Chr17g0857521 [Helianthus annuus]|nr:hypothetical protein HanIR_Chr17g0857521 [Helianthus annuus]
MGSTLTLQQCLDSISRLSFSLLIFSSTLVTIVLLGSALKSVSCKITTVKGRA